mmetsp:Transcript_2359/g.4339  ORF Transcript_2359/g.4339 Transcript_2359/m.4339 type:complete len:105 (+) Transcript_2359:1342-1656(+)
MLRRGHAICTQARTPPPLAGLEEMVEDDIISNFFGKISLSSTMTLRIPRECKRERIRERMAGLPCLPSVPNMIPTVIGDDDDDDDDIDEEGSEGDWDLEEDIAS